MHKGPDRIRNVALVGHRGSGKTSLHEALLFEAGATNRLGSVAEGSTVSDSDEDEQAREMSISAAVASFEWQDRKINLIDTPGEPSFVADALGALRVCESAVFVVNAVMGVEVTTAAPLAARAGARPGPPDLREHARPRAGRLLPQPAVAQGRLRPARRGDRDPDRHRARGLGRDRPRRHEGLPLRGRRPRELHARSRSPTSSPTRPQEYREKLMDEVAENSDALMERYLEGEEISHDEIVSALKEGVNHGGIFPVTCGVATANLATNRLLDAIVDDLPSPVKHGGLEVGEVTLEPEEDARALRLRLQDPCRPVRRAHQPLPRLPGRHEARLAAAQHAHPHQGAHRPAARAPGQGERARRRVRPRRHRRRGQAQGDQGRRLAGRARRADHDAADQAAGAGHGLRDRGRRPRATRRRSSARCAASRRRTRRSTCTATSRPASRSSRASPRSTSR